MKILNNTTGRVWFTTSFDLTDGRHGGDCGWIEPDSPPHDYPFMNGMINVKITLQGEGITYTDLTDDTFVRLESSALEAPAKVR